MGLLESSKPVLPPPVAVMLLAYEAIIAARQLAGEGNMGPWKVKMPQILFLLRFTCFSCIDIPDCCKPLVNFQSPEKVDLDSFCQCSSCFCGGAGFVSPSTILYAEHPQPKF